jgi:hypothetical protein
MTGLLPVPQDEEAKHDDQPVDVIRYYRSVSGRVLPPKERIEDAPPTMYIRATALVDVTKQAYGCLGTTYIDMPDTFTDIVRSRTFASFSSAFSSQSYPLNRSISGSNSHYMRGNIPHPVPGSKLLLRRGQQRRGTESKWK